MGAVQRQRNAILVNPRTDDGRVEELELALPW